MLDCCYIQYDLKKEVKINKLGVTSTESKDVMLAQLSTRCILTCEIGNNIMLNDTSAIFRLQINGWQAWIRILNRQETALNPLWQNIAGLVVDTFLNSKVYVTEREYTHELLPNTWLYRLSIDILMSNPTTSCIERKMWEHELFNNPSRSHLPIQPYRQFCVERWLIWNHTYTHWWQSRAAVTWEKQFISTFSADDPAVRLISTSGASHRIKSTF